MQSADLEPGLGELQVGIFEGLVKKRAEVVVLPVCGCEIHCVSRPQGSTIRYTLILLAQHPGAIYRTPLSCCVPHHSTLPQQRQPRADKVLVVDCAGARVAQQILHVHLLHALHQRLHGRDLLVVLECALLDVIRQLPYVLQNLIGLLLQELDVLEGQRDDLVEVLRKGCPTPRELTTDTLRMPRGGFILAETEYRT